LQLAQLAVDLEDQINELDINPVIVFSEGRGLKAADALISLKSK